MDDREVQLFLDRALTAIIGTSSPSRAPHGVPVRYRYDQGRFLVWTDPSRRWVRNLQRSPDVSVVVAEHAAPFAAVVARGKAEIETDGPELQDQVRQIVRRYLPEHEVEDYIAQWSRLRTIVRITPQRITAWARGY